MYSENLLISYSHIGSQARTPLPSPDLSQLCPFDLSKRRNRDFQQLIVNEWGLPNRAQRENDVVEGKVFHNSRDENLGFPGFPFRGAKLSHVNVISVRPKPGFGLEGYPEALNEQVVGRLITPGRFDNRKRLTYLPKRLLNKRLEVDALGRDLAVD